MKKQLIKIIFILFSLAGIVWFYGPILYNVKNVGNIFGTAVCVLVFAVSVFWEKITALCKKSKGIQIFCLTIFVLFCAGVVWSAILTWCMLYGANAFNMSSEPPKNVTVVVLGSKVNGTVPSADLRARIGAASKYLKQNPQAKCIASGGRGTGELIPEAVAIKEYLIKDKIDSSRIFIEDKSTTTLENLQNSLKIIKQKGLSENIAIVTDEYHQFRAGRMAQSIGAASYPVCAETPRYIFSACYARELLALTKFLIIP